MSQILNCPGCGVRLRLPDNCTTPELSCPQCLARIANPTTAAPPAGIQTGPPASTPPAPTPAAQTTCPSCGHPVDPRWRFCPQCEEPLRGRWRVRASTVDVDVRRDSRGTGGGMIALAILGAIAIANFLFSAVAAATQGGRPEPLVFVLAVLFFLVLISALTVYGRQGTSARPPSIGRVVVGTLAMVGGMVALVLGLGVALFIFAFIVCLSGGCRLH